MLSEATSAHRQPSQMSCGVCAGAAAAYVEGRKELGLDVRQLAGAFVWNQVVRRMAAGPVGQAVARLRRPCRVRACHGATSSIRVRVIVGVFKLAMLCV